MLRKRKITEEIKERVLQLKEQGFTYPQISKELNISEMSIWTILKESKRIYLSVLLTPAEDERLKQMAIVAQGYGLIKEATKSNLFRFMLELTYNYLKGIFTKRQGG